MTAEAKSGVPWEDDADDLILKLRSQRWTRDYGEGCEELRRLFDLQVQAKNAKTLLGYDEGDLLDNVTRYKKYAESEIALRDRKAKMGMDYIERLQAENAKLRSALEGWVKYFQADVPMTAEGLEEQGDAFTHCWFETEKAISEQGLIKAAAEVLAEPAGLDATKKVDSGEQ